jgi:5-methylthioadenosine/S-adenosylhomocysteine deaminase
MSPIRVGFFDDFKGADTLLIDVSADGLRCLIAWIREVMSSGRQMALSECPGVTLQAGTHEGVSGFQKALDHGARPGLSIDHEVSYGTDMFTEMHVAFSIQRALAASRKVGGDVKAPAPVNVRTILECATVNGAACAGLAGKCGALKPGMEADIVMIRTDDINLYPSNNAIGTVVLAADTRNIDTVIIGGETRKFRGRLVGVNMVKLRQLVDESREHLFAKVGYTPDIFASQNGIR